MSRKMTELIINVLTCETQKRQTFFQGVIPSVVLSREKREVFCRVLPLKSVRARDRAFPKNNYSLLTRKGELQFFVCIN